MRVDARGVAFAEQSRRGQHVAWRSGRQRRRPSGIGHCAHASVMLRRARVACNMAHPVCVGCVEGVARA